LTKDFEIRFPRDMEPYGEGWDDGIQYARRLRLCSLLVVAGGGLVVLAVVVLLVALVAGWIP
jgi:hypothetical protein